MCDSGCDAILTQGADKAQGQCLTLRVRVAVRPRRIDGASRAAQRAPNCQEEHAMNNLAHLDTLIEKHLALQEAIDDEIHRPLPDTVRLSQLKREKLKLKEEISRIDQ
jgi:hypothetical protein